MGRQILPLTVDRLPLLVEPCRTCLFWESTPAQSLRPAVDPVDGKRIWLLGVLQHWGSPGRIALVDGVPVGYVTYAPAHLVPRATAFPTAPVSADAVALVTARIAGEYTGQGLGRALVQRAAKDVLRHGVRAIEVFATTSSAQATVGSHRRHRPDPQRRRPPSSDTGRYREARTAAGGAPEALADETTGVVSRERTVSGPVALRSDDAAEEERNATQGERTEGSLHDAATHSPTAWGPQHCLLPVQFLTAVGFYPVREHPLYPRMRLDLRTALRWSEELGLAAERLFTPVRGLAGRRPVGSVN